MTKKVLPENLRSRLWFNNPADPEMTGIYLERYLNYGLTFEELRSGKPIIGIAQTGSDLSPCNRHHIDLARRGSRRCRGGWRRGHGDPGSPHSGNRQAANGFA